MWHQRSIWNFTTSCPFSTNHFSMNVTIISLLDWLQQLPVLSLLFPLALTSILNTVREIILSQIMLYLMSSLPVVLCTAQCQPQCPYENHRTSCNARAPDLRSPSFLFHSVTSLDTGSYVHQDPPVLEMLNLIIPAWENLSPISLLSFLLQGFPQRSPSQWATS